MDSNKCKACGDCTRYYSSLAVDRYNANLTFIRNPEIRELEVGAIILAPGFGEIPREALEKFGYGKYLDVLTSIEMERIFCVSGPTVGEILNFLPVIKNKLYEFEIKELLKDGSKDINLLIAKTKADPSEIQKILEKINRS